MHLNPEINNLPFDLPKNQSNVIKVIGVGGGGSNAINYMHSKGIKGVDFVVCNTDSQALENSRVENKIQLGISLTEGLGAGANPEIGEKAAMESFDDLKKMLETNTKMVFITAGMGGGTGTGAAPVISKLAKELDILTVGIVTMPFQFEGKIREQQAKTGIEKLRKEVDALIVINNNNLRDIYGNLGFKEGFAKADEVLATASRGIAEVITHHYTQNIDLKDAKTVLSNSGNAIMGSSTATGTKRSIEAISSALDSPLLNDNRITGAKNVLLLIVSGKEEITIDEIGLINDYIQEKAGHGANIIMGVGEDLNLENSISVTVIATGFAPNQQDEIIHSDPKKIIHNLDENSGYVHNLSSNNQIDKNDSLQFDFASNSIDFKNTNPEIENLEKERIINDINVDYKEMNSNLIINEDEIEINDVSLNINEIEVTSPEELKPIDQVSFDFDMPLKKQIIESDKIVHELIEDINEIEVVNPVHIIPVTEVNGINANKSGIDDYEIINKTVEPLASEFKNDNNEVVLNPLNSSIADGLSKRTEERKIKLKQYNYNFTKANNINSMENEPAFKRAGVSLDSIDQFKSSRTVISEDSNGEINLRTSNSFLHDNVD
ncbi:cell division protein FtsZ [Flavobacteriaceae bacterium]|jgi:cell division protein FtsZ|nr:cell division protein FtsZ [Flavobacteriaceae bacterium]MDA7566973.1 cell division protein FtsZ [Flavobacteriaceae bacterium]MDA9177050.1 cell division protein FtsZ [Flavobacteriaceae bacterium]MDB0022269.1 cell division protein FtsZ [Flavobacteriaceae bacterium]MDB4600941.1 cell division protein FtsZ [Flavobacteriaceae bacterium]